jgi:hypothetical protein
MDAKKLTAALGQGTATTLLLMAMIDTMAPEEAVGVHNRLLHLLEMAKASGLATSGVTDEMLEAQETFSAVFLNLLRKQSEGAQLG